MLSAYVRPRLAGLVCAWVAVLLIVGWLVFAGREVAIERGRRSTAAFSAVVEQQIERTFQAVYLTLGAVRDAYQLTPHPAKNDAEFRRMMRRRLEDIPFVRATFIIGKDGWIIHDTDYPNTPAVSLADRPYFQAYTNRPQLAEQVGPPLLSRSGTGWFLPVTRRLGEPEEFEGVVVAALQAAHFEQQFRAVGLPEGYLVSLFHADGTLVATYPHRGGEVGRNYAHLSMFALLDREGAGTFWTENGLVPGRRLVSYRTVAGAPFVVRVSRTEDDVLAEWRQTAIAAALATSALTLFVGWLVVRLAKDSDRRRREREQRAQTEKFEALGQLASGMAHDFANLLQIVEVSMSILKSNSNPESVEQAVASAQRAVESGTKVAQRLLAFGRGRALDLKKVRLDLWLRAAQALLAQAAGPRVALGLDCEEGLPEVLCDTGELDVTLVNLVVNARDAMGGSGRIDVRVFRCDEIGTVPKPLAGKSAKSVCVTVRDHGSGMTEEVRRRAFEPFYTTKGDAGTGLGLSQVYGFMRQVGGAVSIDTSVGRGTAVHLFFPVAPAGG